MAVAGDDPIAVFYDQHPYPPPVSDLDGFARRVEDSATARVEHHRVWPERPPATVTSVLVAGCGTTQAVRHALRRPAARVVAVDVSATAVEHTRRLADHLELANLEVRLLPIEAVTDIEESFDHIVCTGVLHHLEDPPRGLACLREVLARGGAMTLMIYARYGRTGVHLLRDYCRRLGVTPTGRELGDLVSTLREIPAGHPLTRLLRESRDFLDDDALADALLNPRERAYSVPELFDLLAGAGLRFGRWVHQAPYLPDCGSISETPHAPRIASLPPAEQFATVELFRGTITRHSLIAFPADEDATGRIDFAAPLTDDAIPLRVPAAVAVQERLPPGAAAALLNRAHIDTDLVLFVDARELEMFELIDGTRSIGELGDDGRRLMERLWRHDLVVVDASDAGGPSS
jgi:SAM-dependent methyltransferase